MPKRLNTDVTHTSFSTIQQVNGQSKKRKLKKNYAAVALGRLGGLKGGKARAQILTAKQRVEIARRAAAARWKKLEEG